MGEWTRYYEASGDGPRETLLLALDRFAAEPREDRPPFAVDLGCGTGRDTVELLRRGWRVLALDGEQEAIERLLGRSDVPAGAELETRVVRFEDAEWPAPDLVTSSYALPFCPPEAFPAVWDRIARSLARGGRFCGQLFGDRDEWADEPGMTFLTRERVEELLEPYSAERFDEEEEDGKTAIGEPKHWHVFQIVARKRG